MRNKKNFVKVLIVPYTSGMAKEKLFSQINFESVFRDVRDVAIDDLLLDLKRIHEETRLGAIDKDNFHRWKDRIMGASSPSEILDLLHGVLYEDMDQLASLGLLRKANYDIFFMSDGMLTPIKEQIDLAVGSHYKCAQCVSAGTVCPSLCQEIRENLEQSLGLASVNSNTLLSLKMGKIHSLQNFFRSGRIVSHFVQVNQQHAEKVYPQSENLFEILSREFTKYKYSYKNWKLNGEELPFNLVSEFLDEQRFALAGLIILNPHIRISSNGFLKYDSDGDGLFDQDEKEAGLDPLNPRSNGVCLDSMAVHPAYEERCLAFSQMSYCDIHLDGDMDSLNECEEELLGTNPFDFDTDNDLIPDYFEWTYGFNPIFNEKDSDTNGDGVSNLDAFLSGIGPGHSFDNIDNNLLVRFQINEGLKRNSEEDSSKDQWLSTVRVEIENIPFGEGVISGEMVPKESCFLYNTRTPGDMRSDCELNPIETDKLLFQTNLEAKSNKGIALLRLRDKLNEGNIVWRIMKFNILGSNKGRTTDFNVLDFSQFDVLG